MDKWHYYLCGKHEITVHSDHQPLETIVKKPLSRASPPPPPPPPPTLYIFSDCNAFNIQFWTRNRDVNNNILSYFVRSVQMCSNKRKIMKQVNISSTKGLDGVENTK